MVVYADTSFLVSLYIEEDSSVHAKRFMAAARMPLGFTPFHRLETRTALRLRVFGQLTSLEELREALRRLDEDLADGILTHTPLVWTDALREAERIGNIHVTELGARSGDLLHVASAMALGAREFLTFDQRQAALARRAGLEVKTWRTS